MRTTKRFARLLAGITPLAALIAASTANAASDSWTGGTDGTWATSGNWLGGNIPGTGATATFNASSANTAINLGGGVTISNILFDTASASPYIIGSGAVGSQTLTLGQLNGGVSMSSTVTANQTLNANLALPTTGFYKILNDSTANTLTLAGTNGASSSGSKVLTVDGAGTTIISGPIVSAGIPTNSMGLLKTNSGTLILSGGGAFTATNVNAYLPGTAYMPVVLRAGKTLITGGVYTNTGEFTIGGVIANGGAGNNASLILTGGSLGVSSWFNLGRGNGIGGVSSDLVLSNSANVYVGNLSGGFNAGNAANLPKGSLTLNDSSIFTVMGNGLVNFAESAGSDYTMNLNNSAQFIAVGTGVKNLGQNGKAVVNIKNSSSMILGNAQTYIGREYGTGIVTVANSGKLNVSGELRLGASDVNGAGRNAYGLLTVDGGTLNISSLLAGRGNDVNNKPYGELVVTNGGLVNITNDSLLGFAGALGTRGKITVNNGGKVRYGAVAQKWLFLGEWDYSEGMIEVNNGGDFQLLYGSSIKMVHSSGGSNLDHTNRIDVNGGALTCYVDGGTNIAGAGGNIDMQLRNASLPLIKNIVNLNGGVLTIGDIRSSYTSSTRIVNFNGGTLRAAATDGRALITISGASARLNVRDGGAIIDTFSNNTYIASTQLQHSDIAGDAATDGGFTKLGNGTFTLTNGYSYNGPTRVLGGTLVLSTTAGVGSSGGELVVSNATLTLNASGGTPVPATDVKLGPQATVNITTPVYGASINGAGNVSFGTNTVLNLNYGTVSGNPTVAAISVSGSFSAPGTAGTNILINISATGLDTGAGVPIPLIISTGTATTNGFVLGTLPPGIKAVLTNSTTGSLDLLITSAAKNLSWHGANGDNTIAMPDWNYNDASNTNWYDPANNAVKYSEYPADNLGDNVTFGGSGFTVGGTNYVNVTTNVVPATATFSANSPYELSGPGGIGGATALVFTNNSAAVYLYTTNTYTGGTVLASGTLVITNDAALGSSGVNLLGGTLRTEADVTSSRAVTVTANSTLSAPAGTTLTMNGTVSGSAALTKADDGKLTLAGNSRYGATRVGAGTVSLTGAVTNSATTVGSASGNAVMDISGTLVSSNLFVGNASGAVGAVYQTAGTVTLAGGTGDLLNLGNSDSTYGYYNAAGGTINTKGISIGGENNPNVWPPAGNSAYGLMEVNGATINNDNGWIVLARGGQNNIGVLNMNSGSLTYGDGGIGCNWQTAVDGTQISIINVRGGLLSTTNTAVDFRSANVGILNLNGGVLQTVNVTGSGDINFNGGTIRPVANNSTFLNVNSNIYIYSGGANIDDNGKTITIAHALIGATNNGLSGINVDNGGSGYIAPPILTISGDGRGASAIAQIDRAAGTVTNVIITCRGDGYSYANISVTGGGAASAASFSATGFSANTSGGLTKTGAGTLSLAGANTYSGATVVAQGTLSLSPVYQHTNSTVVLSNGAFLTISATDNAVTRVGGLTIGGAATDSAEIAFQLPTGTNPVAALLECNALTLNGTNNIRVSGLLTAGTFPVLKYSSITGTSRLNPALRVPHGYSGVVSNDNATKTIYVTLSGAGGIVWQGYNPSLALTNLWDTTTTNWLTGIDLTTYIEGDKVVFDDTGSGLVLLSNTVSPGGMVITNNSVSYTLQGPGIVSGVGGLTKVGSGSATVNFTANNFSGPTIVSNGSLTIAGGGAIGDSSAVTLKNAAGVSLSVTNGETVGSLAGGGATGGNVILQSGELVVGGNNATTAFDGNLSGTGSLRKRGTGAMSLGGAYSTTGDVSVDNGSINLTGSGSLNSIRLFVGTGGTTGTVAMVTGNTLTNNYSSTGTWWVDYALALGVDNNGKGTFNMAGGTLDVTGSIWVGCWGGAGNWNQTGGTANIRGSNGKFWVGAMQDNNTAQPNGSIGTAIISNATLSATYVVVGTGGAGGGANPTAVATSRVKGDMTVANGGVVNSENDLQVGRSGEGSSGWGSYGRLNIENGGIVNVASTVTRWMTVGRYNSIDATVNIKSGGTVNLNAGTDLIINEGDNTGIRVVNVAGTLQGTAAGGSYVDLNANANAGGTTTFNITNGGLVAVDAIVGKANCALNFANGTLKATASDVNFIGAGFTVNILPGGAILDTAGFNPTVPGNLLNNGVDQDGGLTKNGNGTLYLNGVNTYTNVTTVNAGKLGGTGTIAGRLVVNSTAGLAPGNSGVGALTVNGNITLNAGSTNVFAVNGTTPANDSVVVGAGITYAGVLRVASSGTLTAGQEFQLFSGAGATNTSNFASVQAIDPAAVFSFTNGVLKVVSYSSINTNAPQLQVSVSGNQLTLGWPTNAGWILQSNSVSLANGSAWFNYPANGAVDVTNIVITMDPAKTNVFYRMLKP